MTSADPEPTTPAAVETWHIHSPYPSLSRTRLLLDKIGFEVLPGYSAATAAEQPRRFGDRPGAEIARLFHSRPDVRTLRTVELVVAAHPSGGFELYVTGLQTQEGRASANPDLPALQAGIAALIQGLGPVAEGAGELPLDRRSLAYQTYQLSYIESDRAIALLKALNYSTVEFNEGSGETLYDRIFVPNAPDQLRLPIVIKMISASKTSLQESTEDSGSYTYRSSDLLPDLGGVFLHRTTAAEPQNRLLVAYDPYDLDSLERIVNLLRDVVDIPARQIVIEALVIEIQGDVTKDLGVTWGAKGTSDAGRYLDTFDLKVDEGPRVVPPPFTFLFNRRSDTFEFNAALHALLETSKAKVLSNPSVLVLDGRQAKIQIGNRIPVVETTVTTNTATESILYFPVGIVLNLRPRVSDDGGEISMQVETIVSAVRQTLASATSSTRAPEVESRQVQTFVRVQNDTPFIIGGLTTNEEVETKRGVPFFSKIPGIGALFRRKTTENIKKEIIIVVTPHIVPEQGKIFSYVIPQESPIFDSFGHELLYNAYRIRQQDVFDLDFLYESNAYRSLVECAGRHVEAAGSEHGVHPDILALLDGQIPGEEILVRRMLWEIVRKTQYAEFINIGRLIFFESTPVSSSGNPFELAFLAAKVAAAPQGDNAVALTFLARPHETPDRPFGQPTATVSYEAVTTESFASRLAALNRRLPSGEPETWSLLLTQAYSGTAAPDEVLRGVIVLEAIVNLNPNLPLTIRGFHAGRQIIFPTETELQKSYDLIDPEVAKLFYEVTSYYPAFEEEFKHHARRLVDLMGGCEWWSSGDAAGALSAGAPAQ